MYRLLGRITLAQSGPDRRGSGRRGSRKLPLFAARFAGMLALLLAAAGHAQTDPPVPSPVFPATDSNGVDLSTGTFNHSQTDVVIGQPGRGGLAFTRHYQSMQLSGFWTHNHTGYVMGNGNVCSVAIGTFTETFTATQIGCTGTFTSDQARGASLSYNSSTQKYTYTSSTGTEAIFDRRPSGTTMYGMPGSAAGYLVSVTTPTAEVTSYTYSFGSGVGRLERISNNLGYLLSLEYPGTVDQQVPYSAVTGINLAVEYCTGGNCPVPPAGQQPWPRATYSYGSGTSSVTNRLNETVTFTYGGSSGRLSEIQYPDHPDHDISIAYDGSGRVSSVDLGFGIWSYAYTDNTVANPAERTTTMTNPGTPTTTRTYVSFIQTGLMKSISNELNETTSAEYDTFGRATKVTSPSGVASSVTYDSRGNITQTKRISKTPNTPADIITSAIYPATCTNPRTCNKPTSTTDARGYRTDYTYDATHGGLLTVTAPAPAGAAPVGSGSRPQTRTTYSQFQARYKNSTGAFVNGTSVWRLSANSACAVGVAPACLNTADETRATLTYPGTGTANNALPSSATTQAGNGTPSVTTSLTYTRAGDLLTVDGPLSGTGDTTRYYYDALRRVVGVVGPDPDGAGTLLYRAVRTTYNTAGLPSTVEQGTLTSQGDTALSGMVVKQKQEGVYDTFSRPITLRLMDGASASILALSQLNYDSRNRPLCTAVRMDSLSFASPPADACTLSAPAGRFGEDRILRQQYDAAGRVLQEQSAYGTSLQQTTAAYTYTAAGQVATLTDARSYRTTYEYDGFDRVVKRRYPSPSTVNQSSTTDFEQYDYDAFGRLSQQIRRGGELFSYSYDNLGQITLRNAPGSQPDVSFTYDLLSRGLTTSQSGNTLTTVYDALSRVTSVTSSVLGAVSYQYDAAGRRTRMDYPGGFFITYGYDTVGELTSILQSGTTSLATYTYDDLGRRTSLSRADGVITNYMFDTLSRLASLQQNPPGTTHDTIITFGYNPAGQITTRARTDAVFDALVPATGTQSYTADGLNRYSSALGFTQSYDAKGNLTGDGTKTYGYDADNRLISASGGNTVKYDPVDRLHELAGASTTRFLYDGADVIAEYSATGTVLRRYVHGPGTDEPLVWYEGAGTTDRRWLVADERGSVIGIANDAGTVTKVNKYDVYGAPDATNQGRFQYTGQMWMSELNLYHYKARAYNPRLGRFMQTDPIGVAGGINLYGYVGNDPVNKRDSTGLDEEEIETVTVEGCRLCLEDPVELPRRRDGGGSGGGDGGGGGGGGNADGRGAGNESKTPEQKPEQCINPDGTISNDSAAPLSDPNVFFGSLDIEGYIGVGGGYHFGLFYDRSTGNFGLFQSLDLGAGLGGSAGLSSGVATNLSSFQGMVSVIGAGVGPVAVNYSSQLERPLAPVSVSVGPAANLLLVVPQPVSGHVSKSYTQLLLSTVPSCKK